MKYIKTILLFIILTYCSENSIVEKNVFKISGTVFLNNYPALGAAVKLTQDSIIINNDITDQNGYFEFSEVHRGRYTISLYMNTSENRAFVSNYIDLDVDRDIVLSEIQLPSYISFYGGLDPINKKISMRWDPYLLENFYKYDLFRSTTSGFDETTGTLIFESFNQSDDMFNDEGKDLSNGFSYNTNYYYRLYVCDANRKLACSQELHWRIDNYDEMLKIYFPIKVGNVWEYETFSQNGDIYQYKTINTEKIEVTKILNDKSFSLDCKFSGIKMVDYDTTAKYYGQRCSVNVDIIDGKFSIGDYYDCSSGYKPLIGDILRRIDIIKNNTDTLNINYDKDYTKVKYTLIKNIGIIEFYHYYYALNGSKIYKCNLIKHSLK